MMRLTENREDGNWVLKNVPWKTIKPGETITEKVWEKLYGALWKLRDYEDTGLSPEKIEELNNFEKSQTYKLTKKLEEEQKKHRWIPVTERLPERNKCVLLCMKSRSSSGTCIQVGSLDNEFWFVQSIAGYESLATFEFHVIAWMPLPEPYSEN